MTAKAQPRKHLLQATPDSAPVAATTPVRCVVLPALALAALLCFNSAGAHAASGLALPSSSGKTLAIADDGGKAPFAFGSDLGFNRGAAISISGGADSSLSPSVESQPVETELLSANALAPLPDMRLPLGTMHGVAASGAHKWHISIAALSRPGWMSLNPKIEFTFKSIRPEFAFALPAVPAQVFPASPGSFILQSHTLSRLANWTTQHIEGRPHSLRGRIFRALASNLDLIDNMDPAQLPLPGWAKHLVSAPVTPSH